MSNVKQDYRNELTDIIHAQRIHNINNLFKDSLEKLTGLNVLKDLEENPKDSNFDPLTDKSPSNLLHAIGEYLCAEEPAFREPWSILILTHLSEQFKRYYEAQIMFDLEDMQEEITKKACDIDTLADRALEESR